MQSSKPAQTSQEVIVAAALRIGNLILSVPRPGRHHDVFRAAHEAGLPLGYREQGFVTSTGRFVDRRKARLIAEAAGQLLPVDDLGAVRQHPELFSEDVW